MKVRATIIFEQERHVLLVRKRGGRWTLPGGKLEQGESAADAAVRELLEETGLRVDELIYVLELESGGTRHHVFEVSVLNLEQLRPLNEITDCIWHPLDALHNLNISDTMRSIASTFVRRL